MPEQNPPLIFVSEAVHDLSQNLEKLASSIDDLLKQLLEMEVKLNGLQRDVRAIQWRTIRGDGRGY
jgi:prefoldin subunit 5